MTTTPQPVTVRLAALSIGCAALGALALTPAPALGLDHITNGDFESGFTPDDDDMIPVGWTKHETAPEEGSFISPDPDNGPYGAGVTSVAWTRTAGGVSGDWTAIRQDLDVDVGCYEQLWLELDVKAMSHDLGGSGWTEDEWEFPVFVKVYYLDDTGSACFYMFGWYIWIDEATGPPPEGVVVADGSGIVWCAEIQADTWYQRTIDLGPALSTLAPAQRITGIELGGSGWSFEGKADNVRMFGVLNTENGHFEDGFYADADDMIPNRWTKLETNPSETTIIYEDLDNGPSFPGTSSTAWERLDGGVSGDWTTIEQDMDLDVSGPADVSLELDVKALHHNLGGSGWTEDEWEYPVTLRISYTDVDGFAKTWVHGWYIWIDEETGPPPDGAVVNDGNTIVYSKQIDADVWYPESFDLIGELSTLSPPATIDRIRLGGAGWDFGGKADNVYMCFRADLVAVGDPMLDLTGAPAILLPARPNPFQGATTLRFALRDAGPADVSVYGVDGRLVVTLWSGVREAGIGAIEWDGRSAAGMPVSPGVYYVRLTTPSRVAAQKLCLMR